MAESGKYDITIAVKTAYLADQSDPSRNQYVFAYTITIANAGTVAAQLMSRHWIITDAEHQVQEVRGAGVVGQQPLLRPGESFEYTSGTNLATAVGTRSSIGWRWIRNNRPTAACVASGTACGAR
jgi:ApaG protein